MNNKKTFHEVSEIWCDAKRPIVKHSTLCAYQLTLQTHLLPRFGAAENITEKDVQQFVIDKCTSGLARKTVRDIVAVLKSVIKYGNKHGIFHFEEWEIEYPTQTEMQLFPTLLCRKQTAANIVIKSSAYIDASLAGTAHSTKYRCTVGSLYRNENR